MLHSAQRFDTPSNSAGRCENMYSAVRILRQKTFGFAIFVIDRNHNRRLQPKSDTLCSLCKATEIANPSRHNAYLQTQRRRRKRNQLSFSVLFCAYLKFSSLHDCHLCFCLACASFTPVTFSNIFVQNNSLISLFCDKNKAFFTHLLSSMRVFNVQKLQVL